MSVDGDHVRPSLLLTIHLGEPGSPYPPALAPEHVEPMRRWIAKNTTVACAMGHHSFDAGGCHGVCALGSEVVDERPCLCPCHAERYQPEHSDGVTS